jgi:hypothetical protein
MDKTLPSGMIGLIIGSQEIAADDTNAEMIPTRRCLSSRCCYCRDDAELRKRERAYFTAEKRFSNEFACMIGAEPATTALAGAADWAA